MFLNFALSWASMIKSGGTIRTVGGDGKLAPIDPRDVAHVACAASTASEDRNVGYEFTGPELLSFGDMASVLGRVLASTVRHAPISDGDQRAFFLRMGLPEYSADGLVETFRLMRNGRFSYRTHDVEKAAGDKPRTFEAWARDHAEAFEVS
jgi:uncharacterized protein YbjT (DUF2867 family)